MKYCIQFYRILFSEKIVNKSSYKDLGVPEGAFLRWLIAHPPIQQNEAQKDISFAKKNVEIPTLRSYNIPPPPEYWLKWPFKGSRLTQK